MFLLISSNVFLVSLVAAAGGPAQTKVAVRPGDDVLLQCQVHGDKPVSLLEWIRPELKEHGFVFFYRDQRLLESYQLPSYRGRVQLKDPQLPGGGASVVLRNASASDAGTYRCIITTPDSELQCSISLTVADPESTAGKQQSAGNQAVGPEVLPAAVLPVLVVVVVIVAVAAVAFLHKRLFKPPGPAPETPADQTNEYKPAAPAFSDVTEKGFL